MIEKSRLAQKMESLVDLVARLRGPGGCPWDARQDDSSIKGYLIEEAYEVADAVDRGRPQDVRLELGDLLFQILFLADLASERGEFDLVDVVDGVSAKMIHRHPHVFGSASVSGPEEVVVNWDKIKQAEKSSRGDETSILKDVPGGLPALFRAYRIQQRAERYRMDTAATAGCWEAVLAAFRRLEDAVSFTNSAAVEGPAGDLLFAMVALCRRFGLNAEEILQKTNRCFVENFETQPAAEDKG
jgi:MazG family protein